jgi:2-keto-3-deoxy-L-rhamnonate aldolase RhmA
MPPDSRRKPPVPIVTNHARQRLEQGRLSLGIGLRQARTPDIAEIAASCGFDWLFVDLEHNAMGIETASGICAAALATGITPIVRVASGEHALATRLLDTGAMGIVFPHINTAAEAAAVVSECRYPPAGHRSVTGMLPQARFQPMKLPDLIEGVNRETLIVGMLETPAAIANAAEIAAVPGLDVLLIGGNDLAAEMGIPGQFGHARMLEAVRRVVAVCREAGKHPGLGGIYDHALMERYIGEGTRFILGGSDLAFMMAGAQARTAFLRGLDRDAAAA